MKRKVEYILNKKGRYHLGDVNLSQLSLKVDIWDMKYY